ncbi:DUF4209 domain-containing protein [Cetobacterium sp.]|uniref:DUF4209 domain-containing protein n=1 Tax=Cetobacterium sp. TaxID=2071632 RepID=UPI003F38D3F9
MEWNIFLERTENLTNLKEMEKILKYFKNEEEKKKIYNLINQYILNLNEVNYFKLQKIEKIFSCIPFGIKECNIKEEDIVLLYKTYTYLIQNLTEYTTISSTIKIKNIELKNLEQKIIDKTNPSNTLDFIFYYILSEFKSIQKMERNSLRNIIPRTIVKKHFSLGILPRESQKEYNYDYSRLQICLYPYINLFRNALDKFNSDDLIEKSKILNKTDKLLLKSAIKEFKNNNFIIGLSLITSRIESLLRNLIELKGGIIIIYKKKMRGFSYKSLKEMLETKEIVEIFDENFINYLKALFNDTFGINIRNELSHGILEEENSLELILGQILLIFLYLISCNF